MPSRFLASRNQSVTAAENADRKGSAARADLDGSGTADGGGLQVFADILSAP